MSKKVKVRVAVAVGDDGNWAAEGCSTTADWKVMEMAVNGVDSVHKRYWLEAELEVPEVATVQADVVEVE